MLPPSIQVCPVEIPGRGRQQAKAALTDVCQLAETLAHALPLNVWPPATAMTGFKVWILHAAMPVQCFNLLTEDSQASGSRSVWPRCLRYEQSCPLPPCARMHYATSARLCNAVKTLIDIIHGDINAWCRTCPTRCSAHAWAPL